MITLRGHCEHDIQSDSSRSHEQVALDDTLYRIREFERCLLVPYLGFTGGNLITLNATDCGCPRQPVLPTGGFVPVDR